MSEDRLTLGLVLEQPIASNILITILDKLANARFGLVKDSTRRSEACVGSAISRSRRPIPKIR